MDKLGVNVVYPDRLNSSINSAINFIESKQFPDGLWRDFQTLAGKSSDWVTGFICYSLYFADPLNKRIIDACKALLFRQRPNGGWSYNKSVPTDCDSTAWVLMALSALTVWKPSAMERAVMYIKRHQDELEDGFSTYSISDRIDRFIEVSDPGITQGWLKVHPSVTSLAIQSMINCGKPINDKSIWKSAKYILRQKKSNGLWESYWWRGFGYCTYNSLKALFMTRVIDKKNDLRTHKFIASNQNEDGGWGVDSESEAFETSYNIRSLLLFPTNESLKYAQKGISWLLQWQNQDGSWPVNPILRIPPPMSMKPENIKNWKINKEGTGVIIEDQERLFTTAAVLNALAVYRAMVV